MLAIAHFLFVRRGGRLVAVLGREGRLYEGGAKDGLPGCVQFLCDRCDFDAGAPLRLAPHHATA